jgi:hypothetical protein
VGFHAGYANTIGGSNQFEGYCAGQSNTNGQNNLFHGYAAGLNNKSGSYNHFDGFQAGSNNKTGSYNTCIGYNANVGGDNLNNAAAIGYSSRVNSNNSMVLGGTGSYAINVGIGTSTPQATLHVAFDATTSAYNGLAITNTHTGGKTLCINQGTPGKLNFTEPNVIDLMTLNFSNGCIGIQHTSPVYLLHMGWGAYCNGSKWIDASDSTLKHNIKAMNRYGLNEVMKLHPIEYYYKSDKTNKLEIGFIAQEIKNIIPEVVFGNEGNMGISYGSLIPVLVNAVKELKDENDRLKADVEKLKASVH